MTEKKKRPPSVMADPLGDAFPDALPRDDANNVAENVAMSADDVRALGAMDLPSAMNNKKAQQKAQAMVGPNPTSVDWSGVDQEQKYDQTMRVFGTSGLRVSVRRISPPELENHYGWILGEQVPTFADLVKHVRERLWDGEGSKIAWAIRAGTLNRAQDTFPLGRDEVAIDRWRNRPTASPQNQHLAGPPMQQPPGWGQPPPPPYAYAHQQQPPAPQQQAPQPPPPPQPIVVQAPAPSAPYEPQRVKMPDGTIGYVVNGEIMVPASAVQQPSAPAPMPAYQPPPPPVQPVGPQPVRLPNGQVGFLIGDEIMIPASQVQQMQAEAARAAQAQYKAPPAPPAPAPQPMYAPPSHVSGPPGLPAMPPPIAPFWNPYLGKWEYPNIQPPAPPAPPLQQMPQYFSGQGQVGGQPGVMQIPGEDMSSVARNLGKTLQQVREIGSALQPFASLVGLQPADMRAPADVAAAASAATAAAALGPDGEKKWDPDTGIFDMGFARTLKKEDGSPDMDLGLGHLAINYDKIGDQVDRFMKTRIEGAKTQVELEERRAKTRALELDNEIRRRQLENGTVRQDQAFPVLSQESSPPSLPAQAQGGYSHLQALHGPPPDEDPSDGGDGPTQAE